MDRREFLRTVLAAASSAAIARWRSGASVAAAAEGEVARAAAGPLVAIKRFGEVSDSPAAVQAALELIGGLDKIVRPGDVVVVKPNLAIAHGGRWVGRVTNPGVMDGVLQAVVDCGGRPVVAEGTCEESFGTTTGFAKEIGLLDVCRRYGAEFVDLNEDEVQRVKVERPLLWPEFHLGRRALQCDRFISVPVMKTHNAAGVTLGMKNLIGTLSAKYYSYGWRFNRDKLHPGERELWNKRYGGDLSGQNELAYWLPLGATIADLVSVRPIDLVVVDGTFGEERNSPMGDLVDIKERSGGYLVMAGTDAVAVDAIGAHVMRQLPARVYQLRFAGAKGLGEHRVERIGVVGERLEDVAVPMLGYITR